MSGGVESVGPAQYKVTGELDFSTVPRLYADAAWIAAGEASNLTIDLGGVTRADSAGLSLLLSWMRRAHASQRLLIFTHVPNQLLNIARVSGVAELLNLEM